MDEYDRLESKLIPQARPKAVLKRLPKVFVGAVVVLAFSGSLAGTAGATSNFHTECQATNNALPVC